MRDHKLHIGLLAAMPQEVGEILGNLQDVKSKKFGDLEIFFGECWFDSSTPALNIERYKMSNN